MDTDGPARLKTTDYSEADLTLRFSHSYEFIPRPNEPGWQAIVTEYTYAFGPRDENGPDFLAYHWHPDQGNKVRYPHIHLEVGAGIGMVQLQKAHIPTGPINIRELVVFAIDGLGVKPLKDDWQAILEII